MLCFITDRKLIADDLPGRAEKIMAAGAAYLMLREKDLPEEEMIELAIIMAAISARHGGRLIVNSSPAAALAAGAWGLQLPFSALEKFSCDLAGLKNEGRLKIGVSVHSPQEAEKAARAGADLLLAGNIFESSCKKGLPGRGLDFIKVLKGQVKLPIWAVGGLSPANIREVLSAGAEAICVRSPLMLSDQPDVLTGEYLAALKG